MIFNSLRQNISLQFASKSKQINVGMFS